MITEQETSRRIGILLLIGTCLFGVVCFAPDAGGHLGAFFKIARSSSWRQPLEWADAWCSLKIVLVSMGLFLLVEALGTMLVRSRRKELAMAVFSTQIVSLLVLLTGGYYFLKSLL